MGRLENAVVAFGVHGRSGPKQHFRLSNTNSWTKNRFLGPDRKKPDFNNHKQRRGFLIQPFKKEFIPLPSKKRHESSDEVLQGDFTKMSYFGVKHVHLRSFLGLIT